MPSHLSRRKAEAEVGSEFQELFNRGYVPVENPDKKSYKWINPSTGEAYVGSIDPTPGVSTEAGLLKRTLGREARQSRLMSQKVTEYLAKKKEEQRAADYKANLKGTDTSTKEETSGRQLTPDVSSPDLKEVKERSRLAIKPTITEEDKQLRKSKLVPAKPTLKPKYGVTESAYRFDEDQDPSRPYVYMTEEEVKKYYPAGWQQWWSTPQSRTKRMMGTIEAARTGSHSLFAGEMPTPVLPLTKIDPETKETLHLINNPYFSEFTGRTEEDAKRLAATAGGNRKVYELPSGYWGVEQKPRDIINKAVEIAQSLLQPSKTSNLKALEFQGIGGRVKGAETAWDALEAEEAAKTAAKTGITPETLSTALKSEAEIAKTAGRPMGQQTATNLVSRPALPQSATPFVSKSTEIVGQPARVAAEDIRESARSVLENILSKTRPVMDFSKLPKPGQVVYKGKIIQRLAPGLKMGGKLIERR